MSKNKSQNKPQKKKRAIVTVGVSESRLFGPYVERFDRTFHQYGEADYIKIWYKGWPTGSPTHDECHYAFKVHAMYDAWKKGYTSILWLDISCNAIKSIELMWQRLESDGHVLIEDANPLGKWSSDHSLNLFGMSRDKAMDIRLMCGTCWGLDLTQKRSRTFLERLKNYATPENFNGTHVSSLEKKTGVTVADKHPRPDTEGAMVSNDERVWGHRADEVFLSLLANELDMKMHVGVEFAGGRTPDGNTCIRSGYDMPVTAWAPNFTIAEDRVRKPVLETLSEHTIDTSILNGGWVLDAGSRDFGFSKDLVARGCKIIALDADPTVRDPEVKEISFMNFALADKPSKRTLMMTHDPQARHLLPEGTASENAVSVDAITIEQIMKTFGIEFWDVVKLDIEGSEYEILKKWPGRIAKQISVEFHEHVCPQPLSVYDEIFTSLGPYYECVRHVKEAMHGAGLNYWNSLFILRDL